MKDYSAYPRVPSEYISDEADLVRRMNAPVWGLVWQYASWSGVTNDFDVNDLYQAAMLQLVNANRHWRSKERSNPYPAYLLTAAKYGIINCKENATWGGNRPTPAKWKKGMARPRDGKEKMPRDPHLLANVDLQEFFEDDLTEIEVEQFLSTLTNLQQQSVRMVMDGYPMSDVARALGVQDPTIIQRLDSVARHYRRWLDQAPEPRSDLRNERRDKRREAVWRMACEGHSLREIARRLATGRTTVKRDLDAATQLYGDYYISADDGDSLSEGPYKGPQQGEIL